MTRNSLQNRTILALTFTVQLICTFGCASSSQNPDNTTAPPAAGAVGIDGAQDTANATDTSDVIARKSNPEIKCPKKARLVNGKCVLKVEETE